MQTQNTMQTVSLLDPAIDHSRLLNSDEEYIKDVRDYVEKREIKKIQPYAKPGMKLAVYHLRRIPNSLISRFVMEGANDEVKAERAFRCAVVQVDNLVRPDGTEVATWEPTDEMQTLDGLMRAVSEREMDGCFTYPVVQEIGAVALRRCFLPPKSDGGYLLPPLSLDILTHLTFRYAAQNQSAAVKSSDAPKTTQDPKSASDGAKPTDATAMGDHTVV